MKSKDQKGLRVTDAKLGFSSKAKPHSSKVVKPARETGNSDCLLRNHNLNKVQLKKIRKIRD